MFKCKLHIFCAVFFYIIYIVHVLQKNYNLSGTWSNLALLYSNCLIIAYIDNGIVYGCRIHYREFRVHNRRHRERLSRTIVHIRVRHIIVLNIYSVPVWCVCVCVLRSSS